MSLFSRGHLQARGYALLQRSSATSGYHFSSSDSDTFTYSDSLNGFLIPSGFIRHTVDNVDGDITQFDTPYTINHTDSIFSNGFQIQLNCLNNEGNLYYYQNYFFNNDGQFIYYRGNYNHISQFLRCINPISSLTDSIIVELGTLGNYKKYIYSRDSLNRVSTCHKYTSADSLNWIYYEYDTFEYGSLLPVNLSIFQPETLSMDLLNCFVDSHYNIISQTIHHIDPAQTYTIPYYIESTDPLTFYFGPGGPPLIFKFNEMGRLIDFWYEDSPNDYTWRYVWGNYVSVDDEVSIPLQFSVYPNPFSASVKLHLNLEKSETADIRIYNLKGQLVKTLATGKMDKGDYFYDWDGTDSCGKPCAAGMYLCRAELGTARFSRKLFRIN